MQIHSVRIYLNLFPVLEEELVQLGICNIKIEKHQTETSRTSYGIVYFSDEKDFNLWKLCSGIYNKKHWNWGLVIE